MNKILIFAGCKESKLLIKKIVDNYLNLAEFHILYEKDEIKNCFEEKENIFFYKINFYAYEAFKHILKKDFNKIVIFVKNKNVASYLLKRVKFYKTPILFVKFWMDFEINSENYIEIIDVPEIVTNKIIDFLPNVPLFARDVGLGVGEILEVEIPPHSPFAYKQIAIFDRYNVKVAALYRNNELKNFKKTSIILPNDKLILVGEPETLKQLFNQIKKNIGAFPQPYGQNIYLLLDMKNIKKNEISKLLKAALFLHRKLKHKKLIIKIINPSLYTQLNKLHKFENIQILTDYINQNYEKVLKEDNNKLNIGLFITNNELFFKYKKTFFELKKPILKIGNESIKKCEALGVILNEKYIIKIAPTIFDLSYQLDKKIKFFDIDPETSHKEIIEYLRNLAKNFNFKNIEFITSKENPIKFINNEKNICLIDALIKVPRFKIFQYLLPKIEESYVLLSKFNQFLIPIKDENENNN
ncbi:potassium transporter TrkA [Caminibacter mediatlanticus TB-2]|uniref:Potassium transporter TrkA n=1 Tax=Caminibacter mediatlanticus TB-2 TaxID=391592 RepID=A0ABX5VC98_9BACT|nr:TrkA C-terminal domain-containing protein [Caminibacter mediatlanticus]QCT95152.1 potassium transporter TrkA [Caminibacter mediatlanticus TB-2]